jgi:hypothetical protein
MHVMMAEAGLNMHRSEDILKSLTLKILKLYVCYIKDGSENGNQL